MVVIMKCRGREKTLGFSRSTRKEGQDSKQTKKRLLNGMIKKGNKAEEEGK